MKNKNRWTIKLAFGLAIFITLGCAGASQLFPTPTPVFTSTPTITPSPTTTPTLTPTITPTPLPDISAARIFLNELPAGFEEIPPEELGSGQMGDGENAFQPQETFAYVNTSKFQMILGMNYFVVSQMDRVGFDLAVNQPDIALKQLVSAMGTENVHDEKILDGLDDLGDARIGMTMIADMEGVPVQVEIVMIRRDLIGGLIMSMTFPGQPGSISLHELGKLFDQNIQETLKTIK